MPSELRVYVCPACHAALQSLNGGLGCSACGAEYPIHAGIPDFIPDGSDQQTDPYARRMNRFYDKRARVYEMTRYPFRLLLYGGKDRLSFSELLRLTKDLVGLDEGMILDIACGPGTLGRRMATGSRIVYGIDLSMSMLRQGAAYVKRTVNLPVHYARADVEALPFETGQFDAALCGAALNVFANPETALREIGRTMTAGAPLVASTTIAGEKGIFRHRFFRDRARRKGLHLFEVPALEEFLQNAGFDGFRCWTYGSMIVFQARRRA